MDRIPPTYSIHLAGTSASGQALTLTSVDVDFSEKVNHETAEHAFSVTPQVAGSFHWQGDLKMIFTPSTKLPLSTKFHVQISGGVQDVAGNSQGNGSGMDFTTVGRPTVTSVSPASGAQSSGVETPIVITFDRNMDLQRVVAALSVEPAFNFQVSWNGPALTITPLKPLEYGTDYTIKIGDSAVDNDGTKLAPYSTTFKTVGMGLRASALIPSPNVAGVSIHTQIAVVFDSPIDSASISGAIKVTPPVSGSTKAISLADDRDHSAQPSATAAASTANVLVFTPDGALAPHTTYSVTMTSTVKRLDGQAAPPESWSFTTGEAPTNGLNQIAFVSDRSGVDNVWLMNPDGSNQRELTSELVPVSGFDFSADGNSLAFSAGGVVRKMSIGGDNVQTLTSGGNFEYAPVYTPDGTGLIVGRRDPKGLDAGYWRYAMVSGSDSRQIAPDGAPGLGSVTLGGDGLTGQMGVPAWSGRAAFNADGTQMLIVRGADNVAEIVDVTGAAKPIMLSITGNSRPVWLATESAYYLTASDDKGVTWSYWKVTTAGLVTRQGLSISDMAATGPSSTTPGSKGIALLVRGTDGSVHLAFIGQPGASPTLLITEAAFSETSPSFSPDGSMLVFGRVPSQTPGASAGIWVVNVNGTGLLNLATDGAYPRWLP